MIEFFILILIIAIIIFVIRIFVSCDNFTENPINHILHDRIKNSSYRITITLFLKEDKKKVKSSGLEDWKHKRELEYPNFKTEEKKKKKSFYDKFEEF